MHKIGNVGIIAKFVFPHICSFLLYLQHMMLVNIKLDISGCNRVTRLQSSLIHFLSNSLDKTKLAILAFLYCGEFVKNPSGIGIGLEILQP